MVSRNLQEIHSRSREKKLSGLKYFFEETRKVLFPDQGKKNDSDYGIEYRLSAKEVQLREIHKIAQLLGIFISLDTHPEMGQILHDQLKQLLRIYSVNKSNDDPLLTRLRGTSLFSLLNDDEQAIVREWLTKRSIQMDQLDSRTLGEIVDFLAEKNIDGSIRVSRTATTMTDKSQYTTREKTTNLVFNGFSEETINEVVSPQTLRELYSRVSASAHSL
jgi:hypothetical protein